MEIKEYGVGNKKKFLFFPGAFSYYEWYLPTVELLKEYFHVYMVVYDGYEKPYENSFISVETTVKKVTNFFKDRKISEVDIVYGLSMGGAMANLLYALDNFKINYVVMDAGITPYQLPRILTRLILLRDVITIKIFRKNIRLIKKVYPEDRWIMPHENGEEVYEEIKIFLNKLSFKTLRNSFDSCNNYTMPKERPQNDTKFYYIFGTHERKDRNLDIKYIKKIYPHAILKEIPDCEHGELCAVKPEEFLKTVKEIINKKY